MYESRTNALRSLEADRGFQIRNQLKTCHSKVTGLQITVSEFKKSLSSYDNLMYLEKTMANGEITLIEYLLELTIYYNSLTNLYEMEKELNQAVIDLYQYVQ